MGEFRLPLRTDHDRDAGEKWGECCLCGSRRYRVLVHVDSLSVAPTSGETVTGATSLHTGVMTGYTLVSGTVATLDGVAVLEMSTPTGYDNVMLEIFQDNENLNGSTSGNNFATVNGKGAVQISGRLIAERDLVEYQGKTYCRPHFQFKFARTWQDEADVEYDENDREA